MKKIVLFLISLLFFIPVVNASDKEINIHLFYRADCPHCEELQVFLNAYVKDHSNLKIYKYEVGYNKNNRELFHEVQDLLDKSSSGVPYLVIGNRVITGYLNNITDEEIKDAIEYYQTHNYRDLVGEHLGLVEVGEGELEKENKTEFNVPLLGKIEARSVSLPILAIIIGLVDGFNPCAMWILLFLITMLFGMKDKKRMWILGITFILTSGLIYLLFMVSWLNLAVFINKVNYIRLLIGLFAVVFGIVNIINYIKKRKDPVGCEVVSDKKRNKIMDSVKKIVTEKKFVLSIVGIILLAISVNVIELMCSLGLPVIFTQVLSLNNLSTFEYAIYMIIYIIFFLIDDIIIFTIAMKTLKLTAISNKYAKYSHLIGGAIMLLIGILMVFKPEWLMFNF